MSTTNRKIAEATGADAHTGHLADCPGCLHVVDALDVAVEALKRIAKGEGPSIYRGAVKSRDIVTYERGVLSIIAQDALNKIEGETNGPR